MNLVYKQGYTNVQKALTCCNVATVKFLITKKKAWNQMPFILSVEYITTLKLLSVVLKKKREREKKKQYGCNTS